LAVITWRHSVIGAQVFLQGFQASNLIENSTHVFMVALVVSLISENGYHVQELVPWEQKLVRVELETPEANCSLENREFNLFQLAALVVGRDLTASDAAILKA
jgi:hypothetical protein